MTEIFDGPERRVPAERAKRDHDANLRQEHQLTPEERRARIPFLDRRLVQRRSAADGRRDVGIGECQPLVRLARHRTIREPLAVERRPQKIPRRVAGEDTPRPVPAMRRRRKPHQQDPRLGIAEARHRPAPVHLVAETGDLLASHAFAPFDEKNGA